MTVKTCNTCGQDLPAYVPQTGDYVQNLSTGQLAIVPAKESRFLPFAQLLRDHVVVIILAGKQGLPPGRLTQWKLTNVKQVHGYFHTTERVV